MSQYESYRLQTISKIICTKDGRFSFKLFLSCNRNKITKTCSILINKQTKCTPQKAIKN